jgi:LysR substrate binding domain-containing protein
MLSVRAFKAAETGAHHAEDPPARERRITPQLLEHQRLYGFALSACSAFAPRLQRIVEPFGLKTIVQHQTANSLGGLFAALSADEGVAILPEAAAPILPCSLVIRQFSPKLETLPVVVGLPSVQPNPQAEEFVRLLLSAPSGRAPKRY